MPHAVPYTYHLGTTRSVNLQILQHIHSKYEPKIISLRSKFLNLIEKLFDIHRKIFLQEPKFLAKQQERDHFRFINLTPLLGLSVWKFVMVDQWNSGYVPKWILWIFTYPRNIYDGTHRYGNFCHARSRFRIRLFLEPQKINPSKLRLRILTSNGGNRIWSNLNDLMRHNSYTFHRYDILTGIQETYLYYRHTYIHRSQCFTMLHHLTAAG